MTTFERTPSPWMTALRVAHPATLRTLLGVVIAGVLFDVMLRSDVMSVGGAVFFIAVALMVALLSGPTRNRWSIGSFAAAAVFGVALAFRASPWLIPFDFLAAASLLWVGASFARTGSPLELTLSRLAVRTVLTVGHAFAVPSFLWHPFKRVTGRERIGRVMPVVRGALLIAPVIIVLALLLGSADAVFASFFSFDVNLGSAPGHVLIIAIGTCLVATLVRIAAVDSVPDADVPNIKLGAVEGLIALGSLVALFAVFAASQVVVWLGGADHVLETAGLTYAEHAREGFFQLLAVAAITLAVLMTLRSLTALSTPAQRRWFKLLALAAIILTLAIVGVALRRLGMYEHVFGLTMLRLFSSVFAVWIGGVFVLFAVAMLRNGEGRWFLSAASALGLAILLGLNIANPEAIVVHRNAGRELTASIPFDSMYATTLSADSVPAIIDATTDLGEAVQQDVRTRLCYDPDRYRTHGWASANESRARATDALETFCK